MVQCPHQYFIKFDTRVCDIIEDLCLEDYKCPMRCRIFREHYGEREGVY